MKYTFDEFVDLYNRCNNVFAAGESQGKCSYSKEYAESLGIDKRDVFDFYFSDTANGGDPKYNHHEHLLFDRRDNELIEKVRIVSQCTDDYGKPYEYVRSYFKLIDRKGDTYELSLQFDV